MQNSENILKISVVSHPDRAVWWQLDSCRKEFGKLPSPKVSERVPTCCKYSTEESKFFLWIYCLVHQKFNSYKYLFQLLQLVIHRCLFHALWPAPGIHPNQGTLWSSACPSSCIYISVWAFAMRTAVNKTWWAPYVALLDSFLTFYYKHGQEIKYLPQLSLILPEDFLLN